MKEGKEDRRPHSLTLALLDVGVELVQSSHGDLSDLRVEQELHQGGGDVFAGRHAGRLSHFTLRERQADRQTDRQRDRQTERLSV